MPKRPKRKKAKSKSKSKPLVSKKFRELIASLVERLGGSSETYKDRKSQLVVQHGDREPFIVDLARKRLAEIAPVSALADEPGSDDTAQQQGNAA